MGPRKSLRCGVWGACDDCTSEWCEECESEWCECQCHGGVLIPLEVPSAARQG